MDPCYNPVKVNGSMNGGRVAGLKVGEGYGFGNRTANLVRGSIVMRLALHITLHIVATTLKVVNKNSLQLRRFDEYLLMVKIRSP
jgi:hypothetical protein